MITRTRNIFMTVATLGVLAGLGVAGTGCYEFGNWVHTRLMASKVNRAKPTPPYEIPPVAPGMRTVSFIVVGDAGTGGVSQREVGSAMAKVAESTPVSFILYLGDNFYESGVSSVTDPQWQTSFEQMYTQPSLQVPFYAILGNHDHRGNTQAQVEYTSPDTRWRMPDRYYAFTVGVDDTTTALYVGLDTNPLTSVRPSRLTDPTTAVAELRQLRWMDSVLTVSDARWKVVFGHHPLYSGGEHGDDPDLTSLVEPVLIRNRVDLYLAGHDHHLEMLHPINGVHYVISGGGGKHRDVTWRDNTVYAATNFGFTLLRMSPAEVVVHFYSGDGVLGYAHTIRK